jgi:hypothetical protein
VFERKIFFNFKIYGKLAGLSNKFEGPRFDLYICKMLVSRGLACMGWTIRSTIGPCPQVPVILKSVSDPMLCATFTYSITCMSTGGH